MLFVFFEEQGQGVCNDEGAAADKDHIVLSGTCQCLFDCRRYGVADYARQSVAYGQRGKSFGRHCPLYGCLCEEIECLFRHQLQYAVDVLVVYHADDHIEMLMAFQFIIQLDLQILPSPGVVSGIAYDFRVLLQNLPAPHQSGQFDHMFEAFPYRFGRNIHTGSLQ